MICSDVYKRQLKTMLANLDDAKKYQSLRDVMETLPAPDLAAVFEDLPAEKLPVLFRLCPKDLAADVFAELTPATQQQLIDGLTDTELKAVVDELFVDDATDLVEEMPANVVKRILAQADPATRRMINELLKYPEDSAGGVMTTELMALRPDMTVAQAMDTIRENGFDKETINNCYVTDDSRRLIGVVSLRVLVLAKNTEEPIKDLMDSNVVSVSTTTDQEDVSNLFEKYGFLAIPVVDAENRLVGIVTIDDAISILQDEASEDIAKMNAIGPSDKPCLLYTSCTSATATAMIMAKKKETSVSGMVMVRPAVRIRGRASASTLTVRLERNASNMKNVPSERCSDTRCVVRNKGIISLEVYLKSRAFSKIPTKPTRIL